MELSTTVFFPVSSGPREERSKAKMNIQFWAFFLSSDNNSFRQVRNTASWPKVQTTTFFVLPLAIVRMQSLDRWTRKATSGEGRRTQCSLGSAHLRRPTSANFGVLYSKLQAG
eukprot:3394975-Amphidinium_carterae.1